MNKRGLNLINCLSNKEIKLDKVLKIVELPNSFKLFLQNYEVGYKMLRTEKILINQEETPFVYFSIYENVLINGEKYNASIDKILDYDEILEEYNNYIDKKDNWSDLGLMKIGYLFYDDVLLLGLEKHNRGEIWRYGNGIFSEVCSKLENNIFDFLQRIECKIDYDILEELGINEKQIYKNYNENFWRIKEI
ncbi:hypothetical protein ACILPE_05990 [Capnocytophaga canimorsus]|uniref:hypothetical protein n=1 Tax=Capnocytophaga canimorsus TaxID=28188 RepID=UPI0037D76C51